MLKYFSVFTDLEMKEKEKWPWRLHKKCININRFMHDRFFSSCFRVFDLLCTLFSTCCVHCFRLVVYIVFSCFRLVLGFSRMTFSLLAIKSFSVHYWPKIKYTSNGPISPINGK